MYQIFKWVWLLFQRDIVFFFYIWEILLSDVGERVENEVGWLWIVCNNLMEYQDVLVFVVVEIFYVKLFEIVVQFMCFKLLLKFCL